MRKVRPRTCQKGDSLRSVQLVNVEHLPDPSTQLNPKQFLHALGEDDL